MKKEECIQKQGPVQKPQGSVIEFVRDVNYPDGSVVLGGASLIKSWELKNAGADKWPEGSKMIFVRGHRDLLGEVEEFPIPLAEAGQAVEVCCPISVPSKPGTYSAFFQLAAVDRTLFEGHRFWVELVVKEDEKSVAPSARLIPVEEKEVPAKDKIVQGLSSTVSGSISTTAPSTSSPTVPLVEPKYKAQLGVLEKMGFANEKLNLSLLERATGNIEQAVSWLLEMERV